MRTLHLLTLLSTVIAVSSTAEAQFSVSGGGSAIPAAGPGGGGTWEISQPPSPATAIVSVPEAVVMIDAVVIEGLTHSWGGDVHATLVDPTGAEHNLFLRPGYDNPSGSAFGTPGNFTGGTYTIVESGGIDFPMISNGAAIPADTYNQTFDTGGAVWTDGANGIANTPLSVIAGPAGDWELRIYDWGNGDNGDFTGWTLTGNQDDVPMDNVGTPYCFGDGSGEVCPGGTVGIAGQGCPNSNPNGNGGLLVGTGTAEFGNDTYGFQVTDGAPSKPGILIKGNMAASFPNGNSNLANSAGLFCVLPQFRGEVTVADSNGAVTLTMFQGSAFGANAEPVGSTTFYQYWQRDPNSVHANGGSGSGNFNFTNAVATDWIN
jgi:hypothetical protein